MPKIKEAPVEDQIREQRLFLKKGDEAALLDLDYPMTRTTGAILRAEKPPTLTMGLRQRVKRRAARESTNAY